MPIGFVQMFTYDIIGALQYAHSQGVRHGDIKSDNVMLALPGREVKVKRFLTVNYIFSCGSCPFV